MTNRPRVVAMARVILAASLCAHPPAAFAQGSSPGKWRETGYIEDETGKRTPCMGEFCSGAAPAPAGLDLLCGSADDIEAAAHEHLAQFGMLFRSRLHNCKDGDAGRIGCDEGSSSPSFARPDATHIEYSFTTQGMGHRMTRLWQFERLGDDCTGTNLSIHRR